MNELTTSFLGKIIQANSMDVKYLLAYIDDYLYLGGNVRNIVNRAKQLCNGEPRAEEYMLATLELTLHTIVELMKQSIDIYIVDNDKAKEFNYIATMIDKNFDPYVERNHFFEASFNNCLDNYFVKELPNIPDRKYIKILENC